MVKSLGAVSFLNDFASEMMYPLLPALVTRVMGGGAVLLGVLDGLSEALAAVSKVVSGRLADRPGWRRPLVMLGYSVAAAVRPIVGVATAGWQVVGLRSLDRLGKGARTPPRDSIIADASHWDIRGRAFGFHRAMDHAGAVLGPLVATAMMVFLGMSERGVIFWTLVPGVLAVVLVWLTLYSVFFLIIAFAFTRFPETLFLLRLHDLGLPVALAPVLWAVLHVVRAGASYPGGWLSDALGARRVMAVGWLWYALVCSGLALVESAWAGALWFTLFGLVAALTEPAERAFVAARGGDAERGRAFGMYHALVGIAALPGGWLLGLIYQHAGGAPALWVSAGLALLLVLAYPAMRTRPAVA